MSGFLEKLAKGVEEFITEYNKAYKKAQENQAAAHTEQSGQNPYGNNGSQVAQATNNSGEQIPPNPQQPIVPGLTAAQQSRLGHLKRLHAQASEICSSRPVVDPRYPEGDPRRYGR